MVTRAYPLSKTKVNRAGDLLRDWWTDPDADADLSDELADAATLMFDYRATFQAPLKKVSVGLRQFVMRETTHPVVVGQRLKRAPQMLNKLARFPEMNLARMQDIGGCRAILGGGAPEIRGVMRRVEKNKWVVKGFKDYVETPAPSGYRAIHIVVLRDERLIEIQLRTQRQHQWAEAVERTALRTRLDLKDGLGPDDLLRYFRMAADGLALEERGEGVDDAFKREFEALRQQVRPYFQRRD